VGENLSKLQEQLSQYWENLVELEEARFQETLPEDPEVLKELLRIEPEELARQPIFPGGGRWLFCHHTTQEGNLGHYEATLKVLFGLREDGEFDFSDSFCLSLAVASRLPDLLHFEDHVYHATSDLDENETPISVKKGKEGFLAALRERILATHQAVVNQEALDYFRELGACLHMVQDLVAHQGMSNAEHAYLDRLHDSPDASVGKFRLAKRLCKSFLLNYREQLFPEGYQTLTPQSPFTTRAFLGGGLHEVRRWVNLVAGDLPGYWRSGEKKPPKETWRRWYRVDPLCDDSLKRAFVALEKMFADLV
jgi:hypothetical protein